MKRPLARPLSALLVALAAALPVTARADLITLRADEWCPYNCAPDAPQPGFMIEVARKVFEKAGHQVDYQQLNWARAIEETRAGKFTAIVGAARGDAGDFVFPEEPLGNSADAYAVKSSDPWTYAGLPSLEARSLGVIRDYSYTQKLDEYIKKNKNDAKRVQVASGDNALELNLRKLQKGRVDTVVDGEYVLRYNLNRLKLDGELKVAGVDPEGEPVYIAFSPQHPKAKEYAELLSRGIAELRGSGELKSLLAKYGVGDWK